MYDENNREPPVWPDTDNHTKFHPDDDEANYYGVKRLDNSRTYRGHYSVLKSYNEGIWTAFWADNDKRRRQDNLAIYDAVVDTVELTDFQRRVGRTEFDLLSPSELSSPGPDGIDVYLVATVVAALVAKWDTDGRRLKTVRAYHPRRKPENNDELFEAFLSSFSYSKKTIASCYQKVQDRMLIFDGPKCPNPQLQSGLRTYAQPS
jgi:hypothetical protein